MGSSKKPALSLPRMAVAFGALSGLLWVHAIVEALKVGKSVLHCILAFCSLDWTMPSSCAACIQ